MNINDYNQGLRDAADYLIRTAQDLEQRLPERAQANVQAQIKQQLGWPAEATAIKHDKAKAQLLRGQATNIIADLSK